MNEVFFMVASIDTTPTPTYSMFVTVYYLGDLGSGNGLGGSFDVGVSTYNIPSGYPTSEFVALTGLTSGIYSFNMGSIICYVNYNFTAYSVTYQIDSQFGGQGSTFNIEVTDSDLFIDIYIQPL